jgi:hypothetical protein
MMIGNCQMCFHAPAQFDRGEMIRNDQVPVVIRVCGACNEKLERKDY